MTRRNDTEQQPFTVSLRAISHYVLCACRQAIHGEVAYGRLRSP